MARRFLFSGALHPEVVVAWDRIERRWEELKGQASQRWRRLTGDEIDVIAGKRERLEEMLRRVYGMSSDAVCKEVDDFGTSCTPKE